MAIQFIVGNLEHSHLLVKTLCQSIQDRHRGAAVLLSVFVISCTSMTQPISISGANLKFSLWPGHSSVCHGTSRVNPSCAGPIRIYYTYLYIGPWMLSSLCLQMHWHLHRNSYDYKGMFSSKSLGLLTHLPQDKMAPISQTIFSNAFSWMKKFVFFSLKFIPKGPIDNNPALV